MEIRKALAADLPQLLQVYACARQTMRENGNPTQWGTSYPPDDLIATDIQLQQCYVCVENGSICGVFMFSLQPDADYAVITQGNWQNNAPYGVIHRVASNGSATGVLAHCIDFAAHQAAKHQIYNLRIDTHQQNFAMQHLLAKHGFAPCGVVQIHGSPRIAYQLVLNAVQQPPHSS